MKPLKQSANLIEALKEAIRKNKVKRKVKKTARKIARRETLYKLKSKVDNFMKDAFEPKSAKTARRKKKKIARKRLKEIKTKSS